MQTIRFFTSGESHGKALTGILEGVPSGFPITSEYIDRELRRRQGGHGRGGRMKIESDHAEILSGVRWGKTIGAPITLLIENKDWANWQEVMSSDNPPIPPFSKGGKGGFVTRPRPGPADLAGAINKIQDAKKLMSLFKKAEKSPVRCPDEEASKKMVKLIDKAVREGNSLGGIFEVFVIGVPVGLGSHIQWDRRLDGRLAQALMSIQAIKGVEVGLGFEMSGRFGSEVMDEIFYAPSPSPSPLEGKGRVGGPPGFYRKTNYAGGIEGGMQKGMPIILKAAMKPLPTQRKPLQSVDIITKETAKAAYERSDICAVPAAGVIGEAMVALTIADAFLEKFGGDSISEVKRNYDSYINYIKKF